MVREEEPKQTPGDSKQANPTENSQNVDSLFSPRFKSVAAMAGWDEETLIIASLVVEDTPDRQSKHKKRSDLIFKTPPSNTSRRKRRAQRKSPVSTPIAPLNLDEETSKQESIKESMEQRIDVREEKKTEPSEQDPSFSCSAPALQCMDKLREELSCAICLDICFEPSTTPCGHSFCKKCLRSAADKCGKRCPKCRQLIGNGRSCTVNTVLWNTIQLLFPKEVEARKAAGALNSREIEHQSPEIGSHRRTRTRPPTISTRDTSERRRGMMMSQDEDVPLALRLQRRGMMISPDGDVPLVSTNTSTRRRREVAPQPSQDEDAALALRLQREDLSRLVSTNSSTRRRREVVAPPSQDEDAALALRLQREEFMESFRGSSSHQQIRPPLSLARANLRAMASRAINIRTRGRV